MIVLMLSMYEICRDSEIQMMTFNAQVKNGLDGYFQRINAQIYERRGIEWYVIDGHYWIELRLFDPRSLQTGIVFGTNEAQETEPEILGAKKKIFNVRQYLIILGT